MRGPFRAAIYAAVGYAGEVAFSAAHDATRGKQVRLRTSSLMLPVYALIQPLYEPLHDRLRGRSRLVRGTAYGIGFLAVEYASGRFFRKIRGQAPWDYSYARVHVDGLIRPGYFFYWAGAGLALEPLHDALTETD